MFSTWMIVASMIMPIEMARPPSDIRFASIRATLRTMNVSRMDSGSATMTTNAPRALRSSSSSTATTSTDALGQRLQHGPGRRLDDRRPPVERHEAQAVGQHAARVDLADLLLERRDDVPAVLAAQHQDDAPDRLAAAVLQRRALAHGVPDAHVGHVADRDRACPASDFSTIDRMSASDWIMPTPRMMYSSDPRVTTLPPTFALLRRMAWRTPSTDRLVLQQLVGVHQDFELLDVAAERVHLGDARDALQQRRHHPVLERAEPRQLAHASRPTRRAGRWRGAPLRPAPACTGRSRPWPWRSAPSRFPRLRAGFRLTSLTRSCTCCRAK